MRSEITDEDVDERIEEMRRLSKSDDLRDMVRAWLSVHPDGRKYYELTLELIESAVVFWLFVFCAFVAASCLFFFFAATFSPVVMSYIATVASTLAVVFGLWLSLVSK